MTRVASIDRLLELAEGLGGTATINGAPMSDAGSIAATPPPPEPHTTAAVSEMRAVADSIDRLRLAVAQAVALKAATPARSLPVSFAILRDEDGVPSALVPAYGHIAFGRLESVPAHLEGRR